MNRKDAMFRKDVFLHFALSASFAVKQKGSFSTA